MIKYIVCVCEKSHNETHLKTARKTGRCWYMPGILVTWEAEIRRILD
jgi:hypothetical protein